MNIGVLIVDDEDDIRFVMRTMIEAANQGLRVSGEVSDGVSALERVDELDPEVIVLDERMPGLSGIETAALILERRPAQRIILCSAFMDQELRELAEATGITACLAKADVAKVPKTAVEVART